MPRPSLYPDLQPVTITHRPRRDPIHPKGDDRWWEAWNEQGEVVARVPERLFLAMHRSGMSKTHTEEAILQAIIAYHQDLRPEGMK